jgi:hypothetical protein
VIDAQSIKTGEDGEARGFDAGKRTTGRKRRVIVDTMGLLLVVAVTSASVQDRAGAAPSWPGSPPASARSVWCGPTADTPTPLIPS